MNTSYTIVPLDKPDWETVGGGISDFNHAAVDPSLGGEKNLCFVLRTPEGEHVGGVIGTTYWGWFYISLMWIREDLRGKGYGAQLMAQAEDEAVRRGAKHAYLDTFDFQAPGFYEKLGYAVFGSLPDFPPGHTRYFMAKEL